MSGIYALNGIAPRIADDVYIAPGAIVAGDVAIGPGSSVWFNAVIRGDSAPIRIGARSNVQDCAVLHVDPDAPCIVGDDVTIGHCAIVHGTTIGHGVTIGMGATVLSRSVVGDRAIVAAQALVAEDTVVRAGSLVMGVPAKERRMLEPAEIERSLESARRYVENGRRFRVGLSSVEE